MRRLTIIGLLAAVIVVGLGACSDVAPAGESALAEALARSAGDPEGSFAPSPLPLQGAEPHRLVATARLTLHLLDGPRGLRIVRTIDRDERGRYRVRDERTLEAPGTARDGYVEGRESVFDGERFASRRLFGPWILRDTLDGSHDRVLRDAYDLAPSVLGAFGPYLTWADAAAGGRDGGKRAAQVVGLPVTWSVASLAPGVAPAPLGELELLALRDHVDHWTAWLAATHRPTAVEGTIARRNGGEVVAGELTLKGEATVEGMKAGFELSLDYALAPLPKAAAFAVPKDAMPERRPRTWQMIEAVLGDDLAAPYRGQ